MTTSLTTVTITLAFSLQAASALGAGASLLQESATAVANPSLKPQTLDGRDTIFLVEGYSHSVFTASLQMSIENASQGAATIVLNGDSHFGFAGKKDEVFVNGTFFGEARPNQPTPAMVLNGETFETVISRTISESGEGVVTITLNGDLMLLARNAPEITSIGLRPFRSIIHLEEFTLEEIENTIDDSVQEQIQRDTTFPPMDNSDPRSAEWSAQRNALKWIDLSGEAHRHVIVAEGMPDVYQGHVTTALLEDGKTMFAVWNIGHGGGSGPMAMSEDGGLTWQRIDDRLPAEWSRTWNCPSIYLMKGADGRRFLRVFAAFGETGYMPSIVSADDGQTWEWVEPLGSWGTADFQCVMSFSSMVQLKDGSYLGLYHGFDGNWFDAEPPLDRDKFGASVRKAYRGFRPNGIFQSISGDAGAKWTTPKFILSGGHRLERGEPRDENSPKYFGEPYVFRSPDGRELCAILRENNRTGTSYVIFSDNEGQTWSEPRATPWALTGDRHQGVELPDGRLIIVFRDMAPDSPTRPHFVAWVGTYDDIKEGKAGQYRIKLLHSFAGGDNGYPGIHLLPDGTIVVTTYIKYWDDVRQHSIVSTRFKIDEIDSMAITNQR